MLLLFLYVNEKSLDASATTGKSHSSQRETISIGATAYGDSSARPFLLGRDADAVEAFRQEKIIDSTKR
jgi:hypothetical protein